jgi:hypothetical protein
VTGNFQISFQVNNNSYDGDSHLLFIDPGTDAGLDVRNSPQSTDTPSINIFSGSDFANYDQYFFPTSSNTLATATTTSFPNMTWTQITITRTGNIITDDVGGQIISADVTSQNLSTTLDIGLGGYATTISGSAGQLLYRDIVVTPEPSAAGLFGLGMIMLFVGFLTKRFVSPPRRSF